MGGEQIFVLIRLDNGAQAFYSTHVRARRLRLMFAISLTLAVFFCTAVLLYQYWRGTLTADEREGTLSELHPEQRAEREHAPPARAA
jgi:hypothetical protein